MTDDFRDIPDTRDLDELGRLRDDVAPPSAAVLTAARARLQDQDVRPAVLATHRRRRTSPVRRRVLVGLSAAAAVAAVAVGSFALTKDGPAANQQAQPGSPGTSSSSTQSVRFVSASQLLDAASANAVKSPTPAEGQYLHVRSHRYDVTTIDEPPNHGAYQLTENRQDSWLPTTGTSYYRSVNNISVDYPTAKQRAYAKASPGGIPKQETTWESVSSDGTYTQLYPTRGTLPSAAPDGDEPATSVWEDPDSVDLASVPRDQAALRASLYSWANRNYRDLVKYGKGDQFTVDDLAYNGLTTVITSAKVAGDLRATLYQVAKTIPGIKLIGSLANYDGTTGIAVGRVDTFHVEHDLIFTADGSTYLGDRTIVRAPSDLYDVPAGTLIGATAVTVDVTGKPKLPN